LLEEKVEETQFAPEKFLDTKKFELGDDSDLKHKNVINEISNNDNEISINDNEVVGTIEAVEVGSPTTDVLQVLEN